MWLKKLLKEKHQRIKVLGKTSVVEIGYSKRKI